MVDLAVRTYGDNGRKLLLLHGLGSNALGWWRVGLALAEAGSYVVAPDLRGHGKSEHPEDFSLASYADDVRGLGDDWAVVVGHSIGGSIALTLFEREPRFAERLVLLDPALILPSAEVAIDAMMATYDAPLPAGRVSADNPTWHPEDARIKAEALKQSSASVTSFTIRHNPDWNLVAETSRLAVPTLLVGADPALVALVPPQLGSGLAALNPLIRFVSIPGSSHSIHRDEFVPLMTAILEFLT